jgi:hypothetical protein
MSTDMSRLHALAAFTLPLVLLAAPAHAERWSADDPAGDVAGSHWNPEPQPCGTETTLDGTSRDNDDITSVEVRHTRDEVRFVVGFRDLDRAMEQSVSVFVRSPRRDWDLDVSRTTWTTSSGDKLMFLASLMNAIPEPEGDECGATWVITKEKRCRMPHSIHFASERITVTVPRHCIGSPDWVQVGVRSSAVDIDGDWQTAGYSSFSDEWGEPADGESTWNRPLGPEVHAPGL